MTKPLEDYDPVLLQELSIWIEDIRESLRGTIDYCERFQNHLPEKEWILFSRLKKIIPDPKEPSS